MVGLLDEDRIMVSIVFLFHEKPQEWLVLTMIDRVHGNASFGSASKRDIIAYSLLKYACGFYTGSIVTDHKLITPKGKKYLWAAFGKVSL